MSNKYINFEEEIFNDVDIDKNNSAETDLLIREEAKFLAQEYLIKEKTYISGSNNSFSSKLNKLEEDNLLNSEEIKRTSASWQENKDILSRIEEKLLMFDKELKELKTNGNNDNTDNSPILKDNNNDIVLEIKKTLQENNENIKIAFEHIADKISFALNNNNNSLVNDPISEKKIIESSNEDEEEINISELSLDNELNNEFNSLIDIKDLDINIVENNNIDTIQTIQWDDVHVNPLDDESLIEHSKILNTNVNELKDVNDSKEINELKNRQKTLFLEQEKINTEISIIKNSINDFINTSEFSNRNILEQTIDNAQKLTNDVNEVRVQYSNLEDEINKIYSTWLENNKLLSNLENLLFELNNKNDELLTDKTSFETDLMNKTIIHERNINELSTESLNIKESVEQLNQRLFAVEAMFSKNSSDQSIESVHEKINILSDKIDELEAKNDFDINENIEHKIMNISKNVVEEELAKRNLLNPENILTREKVIDEVMESDIFNYSLEKKILQVFTDEKLNSRMDEEEKYNFINYAINSDKFKNMIASEVNYASNDIKLEINDRFSKMKNDLHDLNVANANRFSDIESKLNSSNSLIERHEIVEMVFASKELENIINNKLIYVVNDKLDELKSSVMEIEKKILNSVKWYLDEEVQENIKKEIIESKEVRQKIKNDALNAIYNEIQERDKVFDIQKKEFMKSYESLIENNRILENLEQLVLRQVDELEGYKKDKDSSLDLVVEKINLQKLEIEHLKEKVNKLTGKEFINNVVEQNNNNEINEFEIYENIKDITSSLVKDEIKKLNLIKEELPVNISSNNESNEESDFFKRRIKEILMKLEEDYEPMVNMDEKLPLTNELKNNFDDLKIDINDLVKDESKENLNEDFGWFYEKEFQNHKEEKEKKSNKELLTNDGELDQTVIDEILGKN